MRLKLLYQKQKQDRSHSHTHKQKLNKETNIYQKVFTKLNKDHPWVGTSLNNQSVYKMYLTLF